MSYLNKYLELRKKMFEIEQEMQRIEHYAIEESLSIMNYNQKIGQTKEEKTSNKVIDNKNVLLYVQFRKHINKTEEYIEIEKTIKEIQKNQRKIFNDQISRLENEIKHYENSTLSLRMLKQLEYLKRTLTEEKAILSLKFK